MNTEPRDPKAVWEDLLEGNRRFAAGTPLHPNQDSARRQALAVGQHPRVAVFTCGDSRVPAEILFDAGLGDIFVIRTAGEVVDAAVLASLEFAVRGLGVEVLVVLGHENCGAVAAAKKAIDSGEVPDGHQRTLVEQITPSILQAKADGQRESADFERSHAAATVNRILQTSPAIKETVEAQETAIVAARYCLTDGFVETVSAVGFAD